MGHQRFVEAELLLVSGREGMVQRAATVPADNLTLILACRAANRSTLRELG